MTAGRAVRAVVWIGLWGSLSAAWAQELPKEPWRAAASAVEELIQAGSWDEAKARLASGLEACGAAERDARCRGVLLAARGYLHERAAEAGRGDRAAQYARARDAYREALEVGGPNARVSVNLALVLRKLGELGAAAAAIAPATEGASDRAFRSLLFQGDVYRQAGRYEKAVAAYERALALGRDDEDVYRSLVRTAEENPATTGKDLVELSRRLRSAGQPALAAQTLETAIARTHSTDPSAAEAALVDWVALRTQRGKLEARDLESLPGEDDWSTAAIDELRALVRDPIGSALDWWWRDLERRESVAGLLRQVALEHETRGEDPMAAEVLERALELAPPLDEYDEETIASARTLVSQDVALQLAVVYDRLGADERFRRLEEELFNEKSFYLARDNLPASQRMHTVLGLIYYDRARLTSERADNAIFQLEHALEAVERRRASGKEPVAPQPDLQRLLAESYARTGRTAAAGGRYIDAALSYAQVQDPGRAGEMLAQAQAAGVPAEDRERYASAEQALNTLQFYQAMRPPRTVLLAVDPKDRSHLPDRLEGTDAVVVEAVQSWADAWAAGDPARYLDHYAKDYQPVGYGSRGEWESAQHLMFAKGTEPVTVSLGKFNVRHLSGDRFMVVFDQSFEFKTFRDAFTNSLELVREDGEWKILGEARVVEWR